MGVGTVSTAEFFWIPVMGFLRRRSLMGSSPPPGLMTCRTSENDHRGLTVPPILTLYKGWLVSMGTDGELAAGRFPGEGLPGGFSRKSSRQNSAGKNFVSIVFGPGNFLLQPEPGRIIPACTGSGRKKSGAIASGGPQNFPAAGN